MSETIRRWNISLWHRQISVLDAIIIVITSLFCLHLLRNLWSAYPVIVWASSIICIAAIATRKVKMDPLGLLAVGLFCLATLYSVAISFIKVPQEDYFTAIARLAFIAPYALFVIVAIDTGSRRRLALQTFAVWVAISGASIVWQNVFGAVPWFAAPSMRAEAVRYASLSGSLTVFGVASVLALPIAYYQFGRSSVVRPVILACIIVAMLMTLQKAAVLNLFLFIAGVALFDVLSMIFRTSPRLSVIQEFKNRSRQLLVFVVASITIAVTPQIAGVISTTFSAPEKVVVTSEEGATAEILSPPLDGTGEEILPPPLDTEGRSSIVATLDNVLRLDSTAQNDDVPLVPAIYDRFVTLPKVLFDQYGTLNMLTGMGLVGGSGSLGFDDVICTDVTNASTCKPQYPMAHNVFVEFLAMGGLPLLLAFGFAFVLGLWRSFNLYRSDLSNPGRKSDFLMLLLILANAPFTSGLTSQPYLAGILFAVLLPLLVLSQPSLRTTQ